MHRDKVLKAMDDPFGFCEVIFGWDVQDSLYESNQGSGWDRGFPDVKANIDPSSFRVLPWRDGMPMLLADFSGSNVEICPRGLLRKVVSDVKTAGFSARMAMEWEWFNFRKDQPEVPLSTGMFGYSVLRAGQFHEFWNDLFSRLEEAGVPLEGLHTETGPGAMEAAIQHAAPLDAADRASLFKLFVKELAIKHGIQASFMAKPKAELPGCSGHLHQSLWMKEQNCFSTEDGSLAKLQEYYLAGVLLTLPDLMPMYAPTINSYKRFASRTWAPTSVSWGVENRTTACRLIGTEEESRIEFRVPGADANPYLAMAASLASGLYGIKHKLDLELPETTGNAYEDQKLKNLPQTLNEATQKMKNSTIATELFGEAFVQHFVMTREWEVAQYEKAVTDWEISRYFEGI